MSINLIWLWVFDSWKLKPQKLLIPTIKFTLGTNELYNYRGSPVRSQFSRQQCGAKLFHILFRKWKSQFAWKWNLCLECGENGHPNAIREAQTSAKGYKIKKGYAKNTRRSGREEEFTFSMEYLFIIPTR